MGVYEKIFSDHEAGFWLADDIFNEALTCRDVMAHDMRLKRSVFMRAVPRFPRSSSRNAKALKKSFEYTVLGLGREGQGLDNSMWITNLCPDPDHGAGFSIMIREEILNDDDAARRGGLIANFISAARVYFGDDVIFSADSRILKEFNEFYSKVHHG